MFRHVVKEINSFFEKIDVNSLSDDTIVSICTETDKIDHFSIQPSVKFGKSFCWYKPSERIQYNAYGFLTDISVDGEARLEVSQNRFDQIKNKLISNHDKFPVEDLPFVTGGIKFSFSPGSDTWKDFSDSDWFIPRFSIYSKEEKTYLNVNFRISEFIHRAIFELIEEEGCFNTKNNPTSFYNEIEAVPSVIEHEKERWIELINTALEDIAEEKYLKVVLSRKVSLDLKSDPEVSCLLKLLSVRYPNCFVFAFQKNKSVFLGASPEKLATIDGEYIEVDALAGSVPRSEDKVEDIMLEQTLLSDKKNCSEHRAVVDFIVESLEGFAKEVEYDEKPIIRKLPNIQHLWTPLKAKVKEDINMFELIKSLHPTPAICGSPWKTARNRIIELENFDRGMFTGVVGWFNTRNMAEFAVSIRCGLLKEKRIHAFAGCGIVEGSEPLTEFDETNIKLKPVLSLFQNEKICQS